MKIKRNIIRALMVLVLAPLQTIVPAKAENPTPVTYSGTLVALPCTIVPGMENLLVNMSSVSTKTLYKFNRGDERIIDFYLTDCDLSKVSAIKATLTGLETSGGDGLLAFNPGSSAEGAGIRLSYMNGTLININDGKSHGIQIDEKNKNNKELLIQLKAYVQPTTKALNDRSIKAGEFSAVLTYSLHYE